MSPEEEWNMFRVDRQPMASLGTSAIRFVMLFGVGVVALALMLVPILEGRDRNVASIPDLDLMSTGSIQSDSQTYTLRRSVLQPSQDSVCMIRDNGSRSGEC